ncbi:MAG: hypothetical protein PGN21_16750 [Sphingomonas paucimobilis]
MRIRSNSTSDWSVDDAAATAQLDPRAGGDARRGAAGTAAPGGQDVDPSLVAAFDLETPYVLHLRSLRSSILQHNVGDDDRRVRSCALIGLDCEPELAAMAANLAVVMARLETPTLLIDGNLSDAAMHRMVGRTATGGAQQTPVADLWIAGSGAAGQTMLERQPILERSYEWNVPAQLNLAALSIDRSTGTASIAAALVGFDSVVLVARKHVTMRRTARQLIDRLDEHRISIVGVVLV